tara:strand:- start:897 stop:1130 length:234 start_codon:yes stop_codon:yes gene_type:complete
MKEPEQHKPTPKAPAIDELLTQVFGISRIEVINQSKCAFCHDPDLKFKSDMNKKEYRISGICQKCQDEFFGKGGRNE